jgi:hypothetical protein
LSPQQVSAAGLQRGSELSSSRPGLGPEECAAVWAQWKPGVGWKIIVHQDGDESVVQVTVPDDGKSLIYFWGSRKSTGCLPSIRTGARSSPDLMYSIATVRLANKTWMSTKQVRSRRGGVLDRPRFRCASERPRKAEPRDILITRCRSCGGAEHRLDQRKHEAGFTRQRNKLVRFVDTGYRNRIRTGMVGNDRLR